MGGLGGDATEAPKGPADRKDSRFEMRDSKKAKNIVKWASLILDSWIASDHVKKYRGLNIADLSVVEILEHQDGTFQLVVEEGCDDDFNRDFAETVNELFDKLGIDARVDVETKW